MANRFHRGSSRFFLPLALAATVATLHADVRLRGATLRYGMTPAVPSDAVISCNFAVENDGPNPIEATLTVEPIGGGPVYAKTFTVGPEAVLDDRFAVTTSPTESYDATLVVNGIVVGRDKIAVKLDTGSKFPLFVITDDPDFSGVSELTKKPGLLRQLGATTVRAANAPDSWVGYGHALAVVLGHPQFADFSQAQFQAIRDYVTRGGTLLFVQPDGVLDAARTPLQDFLPVAPIRVRRLEDYNFLRTALSPASGTAPAAPDPALSLRQGLLFLESIPAGNGATTINLGEFPVCRWKRAGLGTCGVIAVDLFNPFFRDHDLFLPVWNHILAWTTYTPPATAKGGDRAMTQLLHLLSGFRIPGIGTVQAIVGTYLVIFLLLLIIGNRTRKESWTWAAAALLGILFTCLIFVKAARLVRNQPNSSTTAVSLTAWNGEQWIGEKTAILFSKKDERVTLVATDPGTLFYPVVSRAPTGLPQREGWTNPLRIGREANVALADRVSVQALKPRRIAFTFATPAPVVAGPLPEAAFGADGAVRLTDWTVPAGVPPVQRAFLLFPAGIIPLEARRNTITGSYLAETLIQTDTATVAAEELLKTTRLPVPCLALLASLPERETRDFTPDVDGFREFEYRITLFPIVQRCASGPVALPPELFAIEAVDSHSRLVYRDGVWQESNLRADSEDFAFNAVLPALFCQSLVPQEIEITVDASNPGGNLQFAVQICPAFPPMSLQPPVKPGVPVAIAKTAPTRRNANRFLFTGPSLASLIDPLTGRFGLNFQVKPIRKLTNPLDVERVNRWRMTSVRITVKGQMSEQRSTVRY